jgi:hypothetical protein
MNDYKYPNMADIWLSIFCKLNHIPVIIIKKEKEFNDYIEHNKYYDPENTIYHKSAVLKIEDDPMNTATIQTTIIQQHYPWKIYTELDHDKKNIEHTDTRIDEEFRQSIYYLKNIIKTYGYIDIITKRFISMGIKGNKLFGIIDSIVCKNIINCNVYNFDGYVSIIKFPFLDKRIYKICIENFQSEKNDIIISVINKNFHKIHHSELDSAIYCNINFIDCNVYKNIRYMLINNDNIDKFKYGKLTIEELKPPFGNEVVRNNRILKISDCKIFKKKYNKRYNVACILDNFSYECFSYDVNLFPLTVNNWNDIFKDKIIDYVLFESAWHGNNGEWSRCIVDYNKSYKNENANVLIKIMNYISNNKIPKVFYNKEDPINFDKFIAFSKLFTRDLIITTDSNSVQKYKNNGCSNVISFPFCCQPIIHNPINRFLGNKNDIIFPCTYYNETFPKRCDEMRKMLDINLKNIDIYDRQFVYNRMTLQVKSLNKFSKKYNFPSKYQSNIKGYLNYKQLLHTIKDYKIVMNVNTITDSPTMFARRVMETAAMGIPIVSNEAEGINNIFGNLIIKYNDVSTVNKMLKSKLARIFNGNILYKIAMKSYTYNTLVDKISNMLPIRKIYNPIPSSMCIIFHSATADLNKIKSIIKKNNYVLVSDDTSLTDYNVVRYDNINTINQAEYYFIMSSMCSYSNDYTKNMLLATLYTDAEIIGKGCYAKKTKQTLIDINLEHSFTNKLNTNTLLIKHSNKIRNFFNKNILFNIKSYIQSEYNGINMYSTDSGDFIDIDKFVFSTDYNIELNTLSYKKDTNSQTQVIIMCCWKRSENITKTIVCLNLQRIMNFELYIWNNNHRQVRILEKLILDSKPEFNIHIHNSKENIGGMGRFYMTRFLLKNRNFNKVIFIDDDQIFNETFVYKMKSNGKLLHACCWYGRVFNRKEYKNGKNKGFKEGDILNYGGTGGMIIDTRVFKDDNLFIQLPEEYFFTEDLWLSYYSQFKYNYKFIKIDVPIHMIVDDNDQCHELWETKEELLRHCRKLGWKV